MTHLFLTNISDSNPNSRLRTISYDIEGYLSLSIQMIIYVNKYIFREWLLHAKFEIPAQPYGTSYRAYRAESYHHRENSCYL